MKGFFAMSLPCFQAVFSSNYGGLVANRGEFAAALFVSFVDFRNPR